MDGTVANFFGVDPSVPMAVEIEKTTTATSTRFRFDSPFAKLRLHKMRLAVSTVIPLMKRLM